MNNKPSQEKPDWLDEFEELANEVLDEGDACEQLHPLIANWYDEVMAGDPPESRDSVWQALQCLTTEVMANMPPAVSQALSLAHDDEEDDIADWVTELLLVGRAFQMALDSGRLDDL